MKKLSIPLLFFISFIFQVLCCCILLGKSNKVSFILTSGLSSISATFLAYTLVYYLSLSHDENRSVSDIKIGFTVVYYLIISSFVLFLFILANKDLYGGYVIVLNGIILSIYGRQILNKEINRFPL